MPFVACAILLAGQHSRRSPTANACTTLLGHAARSGFLLILMRLSGIPSSRSWGVVTGIMSWREKTALRLSTDSESEYDLPLRRSKPAQGRPWSKRSRIGKVVARLAATALLGLIIYLSTSAEGTDPEVLAKGIEQCEYIRSRPGPPADFHARRVNDRFEQGTKPVLIRNATIWTGGKGGEEIVEGDVLMDGGVIRKVGDVTFDLIEDLKGNLQEIDAQGAWVTPGLVDGHSHGQHYDQAI